MKTEEFLRLAVAFEGVTAIRDKEGGFELHYASQAFASAVQGGTTVRIEIPSAVRDALMPEHEALSATLCRNPEAVHLDLSRTAPALATLVLLGAWRRMQRLTGPE